MILPLARMERPAPLWVSLGTDAPALLDGLALTVLMLITVPPTPASMEALVSMELALPFATVHQVPSLHSVLTLTRPWDHVHWRGVTMVALVLRRTHHLCVSV